MRRRRAKRGAGTILLVLAGLLCTWRFASAQEIGPSTRDPAEVVREGRIFLGPLESLDRIRTLDALAASEGPLGTAFSTPLAGSDERGRQPSPREVRVEFGSEGGWLLVGDLVIPSVEAPPPVVLLLNTLWGGNRTVYEELAGVLAEAGLASFRIDLRGHGESVNLRAIESGAVDTGLVYDAWPDVVAARAVLEARSDVDGSRLAIVGASYSGELAARAGREAGYADAYVILASDLSPESIHTLRMDGPPWVYVYAADDHTFAPQTAQLVERFQAGEVWRYEEGGHATDLLFTQQDLGSRLTEWLDAQLTPGQAELRELRKASDTWWTLWAPPHAADLRLAASLEGDAIGFGYFGDEARKIDDPEGWITRMRAWLDTLEALEFEPIGRAFRIIGETGLEWGQYRERQIEHGGNVRRDHRGRYTITWVQTLEGWRIAAYHRSALPEGS